MQNTYLGEASHVEAAVLQRSSVQICWILDSNIVDIVYFSYITTVFHPDISCSEVIRKTQSNYSTLFGKG